MCAVVHTRHGMILLFDIAAINDIIPIIIKILLKLTELRWNKIVYIYILHFVRKQMCSLHHRQDTLFYLAKNNQLIAY